MLEVVWQRPLKSLMCAIPLSHVSHLTELIFCDKRVFAGHGGVNYILTLLALAYWIWKPVTIVRRVINKCLIYRWNYSKPGQQMTDYLPIPRLPVEFSPFSCTGVDNCGSLIKLVNSKF